MTPVFAFLLASAAASTTMLGALIATSGRPWPARVFGVTLLLVAGAMVLISVLELFPAAVDAGLSVARVAGAGVDRRAHRCRHADPGQAFCARTAAVWP